jgi:hypothetical protein
MQLDGVCDVREEENEEPMTSTSTDRRNCVGLIKVPDPGN